MIGTTAAVSGLLAAGFFFGRVRRAMVVHIDRTDVHASDDAPSSRISVAPHTTPRALVALATADRFLPGISGDKATWVAESSGAGASADSTANGGATRPLSRCVRSNG